MNDRDRENLAFLLNCEPGELKQWYDSVAEDDHEYASWLLHSYSQELKLKMSLIEQDTVDNVSVAEQYLKKFTLR